jgi:hypothetical protein
MPSASHLTILKATEMGEETAILQNAKWLWAQKLNQEGINTLYRAINNSKIGSGSLLHGKVTSILHRTTR